MITTILAIILVILLGVVALQGLNKEYITRETIERVEKRALEKQVEYIRDTLQIHYDKKYEGEVVISYFIVEDRVTFMMMRDNTMKKSYSFGIKDFSILSSTQIINAIWLVM